MFQILEVVFVVGVMIISFFMVFLLMFLLALMLLPLEKGLSELIWSMTAPPQTVPVEGKVTFKDFSQKH